MAMWASSDFYHNGLIHLSSAVAEVYVCTTQVTSRSSAVDDALAKSTTIASSDWTESTAASGTGRQMAIDQIANLTVTSSGVADHIVLCTTSTAVYITTCNSKSLTTADTVTIPTWKVTVRAPTSAA